MEAFIKKSNNKTHFPNLVFKFFYGKERKDYKLTSVKDFAIIKFIMPVNNVSSTLLIS